MKEGVFARVCNFHSCLDCASILTNVLSEQFNYCLRQLLTFSSLKVFARADFFFAHKNAG